MCLLCERVGASAWAWVFRFGRAVCVCAAPAAKALPFQAVSVSTCPNDASTGLDCYLDAVVHLYTMCRHVKSIEIIEFGY